MDVLKYLKFSLNLLGVREHDGKASFRLYAFLAINCAMMVNVVHFIADRWRRVDDRVFGLKAMPFFMFFVAYSVQFIYMWDEFSQMVAMFYEKNYPIPYKISERRQRIFDSLEHDMKKFNKFWFTMMVAYASSMTVIPLVTVVIKITWFSESFQKVIKDNLSLPFPFYYPEYIKRFQKMEPLLNAITYVVVYAVHSMYAFYAALYAHLANVTSLCAMSNLRHELRSLRLSLLEMRQIVTKNRVANTSKEPLRRFTKYFVQHHQYVYRKFQTVNRGVRWITASISTTASLYICMSIYVIVQKDQIMLKIQEAVFLAVWAYDIFLFDVSGEKIKIEDENLRNALYEISWLDKPGWFKNSLLLSMTRGCRPIDLKPFGMFTLNLKSFAMTMNAAYSYYNLLHNFKIK